MRAKVFQAITITFLSIEFFSLQVLFMYLTSTELERRVDTPLEGYDLSRKKLQSRRDGAAAFEIHAPVFRSVVRYICFDLGTFSFFGSRFLAI